MSATDTIVRPSLLLRSTLTKGQKTAVDSVAKTSQKPDSLGLLRPKKQKTLQMFILKKKDTLKGVNTSR